MGPPSLPPGYRDLQREQTSLLLTQALPLRCSGALVSHRPSWSLGFCICAAGRATATPGPAEVSVRNAGGLMIPGTALGYCRWLGTWCVPGRKWHLTCSSAEPCEERLLLSHFSPMWELRVTALMRLPAPNSGAGLGASPTSLLASRALPGFQACPGHFPVGEIGMRRSVSTDLGRWCGHCGQSQSRAMESGPVLEN